MSKKKSRKSVIISQFVGIIFAIIGIVILVNVGRQVYTMITLQKQAEQVEAELQALKDENAALISTRDKLEDPNYVQTYARGEYMFSKGDEKVFYLPASDNGESE